MRKQNEILNGKESIQWRASWQVCSTTLDEKEKIERINGRQSVLLRALQRASQQVSTALDEETKTNY
jgi:hypothetical protein